MLVEKVDREELVFLPPSLIPLFGPVTYERGFCALSLSQPVTVKP